ncbi:MAG: hypothetical protein R2860_14700 [Desulfobacterales bacterium]
MIEEVCDIIGHHHHPREEETLSFKVLYDADLIANIEDNHKDNPAAPEKLEKIIESLFSRKTADKWPGNGCFNLKRRSSMKISRKIIEIDKELCDGCGQCSLLRGRRSRVRTARPKWCLTTCATGWAPAWGNVPGVR